jgi:cytoskeletal protein CcmA (bactofilin family)
VSLGTSGDELRGEVLVAAGARLEASVVARHVVIDGEFRGRVTAQRLEFGPAAVARGDFHADAIVMREGACVEGDFNLPQETAAEDTAREETPAVEPPPCSDEDLQLLAEAEPVTVAVN